MQAEYPKSKPVVIWDTVFTDYPVRKSSATEVSSETLARRWRNQPVILRDSKTPIEQLQEYMRDYKTEKELTKSVTSLEHSYKQPNTKRHIKHNSCLENEYIYPVSRRIEYRPPDFGVHGTSEMRSAYVEPEINPRLVSNKDQFKHLRNLEEPPIDATFLKDQEPIDTTHEGFEKLLDPYLTTSRLHHRPFTAEQLKRPSNTNDIVTFYTFAKIPWVRRPKPATEHKIPLSRPKSMYYREKFKQDRRDLITHNTMDWVPGSFRTETRDNYTEDAIDKDAKFHDFEEEAKNKYKKALNNLPIEIPEVKIAVDQGYRKENDHIGTGKAICAVLDQHAEKNKRLEKKSMRIG